MQDVTDRAASNGTHAGELVRRPPEQALATTMSEGEINYLRRLAAALYRSGIYKDVKQPEQALAKILVGRDLGLSPARAMGMIHFVEGNVQMHYRALGAFIRENGYHYVFPRAGELADGDDENPSNERAVIDFYGPRDPDSGEREFLGRSRFSQADAQAANLTRPRRSGEPSNYLKFPRNMLVARAMSNGVGWYCPEVLAGIPVYVPGEIAPAPHLADGHGDGSVQGLDLGPEVDAVLQRAQELGHALADRATAEMALADQPSEFVAQWVAQAHATLDAVADTHPPDAEVVEDPPNLREQAAQLRAEADEAHRAGDDDAARALAEEANALERQSVE